MGTGETTVKTDVNYSTVKITTVIRILANVLAAKKIFGEVIVTNHVK